MTVARLTVRGSTKITDAGLKELAGLPALERLTLNATQITGAGLKEFAALKKLRSLSLSDSKLTDEGLKALGELESLRSLDLSQTRITGSGLRGLSRLKSLENLTLSLRPEPRQPQHLAGREEPAPKGGALERQAPPVGLYRTHERVVAAGLVGYPQPGQELTTEQPAQHPHRQEETGPARQPARRAFDLAGPGGFFWQWTCV